MTLKGKTAFVTGGNSGIGESVAKRFALEGANVAIAAQNENTAQQVITDIKEAGGNAIFVKVNVADSESVKSAVQKTVDEFGSLDIAFNNAGVNPEFTPIHELDEPSWDSAMDINIKGVMLCMKYEIQQMLQQKSGRIINMSSVAGILSKPYVTAAYSASKHAVIGLTKNAALFYAKENIQINAICPAVVYTNLIKQLPDEVQDQLSQAHPIGRFGKLEEIADTVFWLSSGDNKFITGQSIVIDGGLSIG